MDIQHKQTKPKQKKSEPKPWPIYVSPWLATYKSNFMREDAEHWPRDDYDEH
jgi:hypothetical protein